MTSSEQDLAALSALMDDEASELELRSVLGSLNSDPALRARWRRQQLVRDLMRERRAVRPEIDVSADVMKAINHQPSMARDPLWSMAVAASVTIAVVLGGQTLMPVDNAVPPTLISELGGNVVPVSGAQPVRASLEAGTLPVSSQKMTRDEPRQTEVAALYERWAKERYQLFREHHAEMASQSHPVPYIARVRADDVMDNPPSSE